MSDPPSDVDEAVCWQCGAPADPACAETLTLYAKSREHRDGQGYPVGRGRWNDQVRVSIPRCEACRNRLRLVGFLTLAGLAIGLVLGGVLGYVLGIPFPLRGWMPAVGFLMGWVAVMLGSALYDQLSGRRTLFHSYPALKRLRQAGWRAPAN